MFLNKNSSLFRCVQPFDITALYYHLYSTNFVLPKNHESKIQDKTNKQTTKSHNVLSEFMIFFVCWTASIAGFDHMWLTGHDWTCLKSRSYCVFHIIANVSRKKHLRLLRCNKIMRQ